MIRGSQNKIRALHLAGSRKLRRKPHHDEIITVTLVLRSASTESSRLRKIRNIGSLKPHKRVHLSGAEFVRRHGTKKSDIALVEAFAKRHRLQITQTSRTRRCVVLSGTIAQFSKAFRITFSLHEQGGLQYRSHQNDVAIPSELRGAVQSILGLENRPLVNHHAFAATGKSTAHTDPAEVCTAYKFPDGDGAGQRIAIVELGGGYHESDIKSYFEKAGLKVPKITCIELDGQKNDPSSRVVIQQVLEAMGLSEEESQKSNVEPADLMKALWTIEATLDVQLAGAFANGAEIVIYFAPNNAQGKYHAMTTALHSEEHPPTIISCSWGAVEENLTPDYVESIDQVFQEAALKGVTVCFSTGDKGEDADKNGSPRAHFPASSPHVLACGGTHWEGTRDQLKEVVWSERMPTRVAQTGGGVSKLFGEPEWQSAAEVQKKTGDKGRGLPDVSGKADMARGYGMIVGGYSVTMGGTSSAVPMWAGLVARLNQQLGKNVGYITSFFYEHASAAFTDILQGSNGEHYKAEPGWDACTGLGTPRGTTLLSLLAK